MRVEMPAPGQAMHGRGLQLPAPQQDQPAHGTATGETLHAHHKQAAAQARAD